MSEIYQENYLVIFEVRHDKDRGILMLTIRSEVNDNVHFFKYHHQPISQHPEQIQRIIRQTKITTRTKSIRVDITSFSAHYWNLSSKFYEFRGAKLDSTQQQILKVHERRINMEVGAIKRKKTVEASKQEKNEAIYEKLARDEEKFQAERAKRVKAAMADMMDTEESKEPNN